jgi:hypothetical protein
MIGIFLYGVVVFGLVVLALGLLAWGIVNERRDRRDPDQGRTVYGPTAAVKVAHNPEGAAR